MNAHRRLPHDHPSDGKFPIFTSAAQARKRMVYLHRTGIVPQIDQLLRSHPGPKSQLSTEALLASALLAAETTATYVRAAQCAVLAGLDSAVAIEWGLCDPDDNKSTPISYKVLQKQAKRFETLLGDGAILDDGTPIGLNWFVKTFLAPSIPNYVKRKAQEIALDATAYPTWAKVVEFVRQADVDSGRIPLEPFHIGADGKVIRCKDPDARSGWRTGTSFYPVWVFLRLFHHYRHDYPTGYLDWASEAGPRRGPPPPVHRRRIGRPGQSQPRTHRCASLQPGATQRSQPAGCQSRPRLHRQTQVHSTLTP